MQDLRLAIRSLRRNPLVSAVAIVSLSLGIGANAAIFALLSSVVLRPLPVREPDRLALVTTVDRTATATASATAAISRQQYSYVTFEQIRSQSRFVEAALAYTNCCGQSILTSPGPTTLLERQYVSGDFFSTLGIRPLHGRLLTATDDRRSAPERVAVISHGLWRERFGAREDAVGAKIVLDRTPLTIVGVTPADFFGVEVGRSFDILVPLRLAATLSRTPLGDDTPWLNVVLRLRSGVSIEQATAALRAAQPDIRRAAMPQSFKYKFLEQPLALDPYSAGTSALRRRFSRPLEALFAVVVLVLLIAAANIGNLLLARGTDRRHEIAIRAALGAPRRRLVREIVTEALVLAGIGACGGVLIAYWTAPLMVRGLSTTGRPIVLDANPDWRVLTFAAITTVATALLCALAPALSAMRVAPIALANERGRGGSTRGSTLTRGGLADVLIVGQVALSLVLLVVGGLFVQTFQRLSSARLGFRPDGVTIARVNAAAVPSEQRVALIQRLVETVATVPGVVSVGASLNPPLVGELAGDLVVSPPGTVAPPSAPKISRLDEISSGWMSAYGVSIVAGRDFNELDRQGSPSVMLVNEAFAKAFSPDHPIVGTTFSLAFRLEIGDYPWGTRTIVGVVSDTAYRSARDQPRPAIFIPLSQYPGIIPQTTAYLGIRTAGASDTAVSSRVSSRAIEDALRTVNGELAVTFQSLDEQISESTSEDRLIAHLSASFAILGLVLSVLGIYGTTAYATARQRRDYGIRIALGASTATIMRCVFARVALLVGLGLIAGIGASLSCATLLRSLLYGIDPRDPTILTVAATLLIAVGLLAGLLPAYHVSKTDPAVVLKEA